MRIAPNQRLSSPLALALALVGVSVSAVAGAALSGASDAHVSFEATGPAGFKLTGATSELTVAEGSGKVVLTVPLANLKTGIDLRDHHMRDKYLEVPKFPNATLSIDRAGLKVPAGSDRSEADAPGVLTLHGQSRPVNVHYDAKAEGAGLSVHGKFHINMNDYGIVVPSYLGITVKPDVDVTASFHATGN